MLARYADVRAALADAATFSSAAGVGVSDEMNAMQADSGLASDDPEHARLRAVLSEKLAPRALASLRTAIAEQADALVAGVIARGSFDAVAELAARLPVDVVADLIGLPAEGRDILLTGADAMFASFGPLDARLQSRMPEVMAYVEFMAASTSRDKLTSGSWGAAILDAVDEGRLAAESAVPLMAAYLIAAMDTTVHSLGNLIRLLAADPQLWRTLKADPGLIGGAFEENPRLESPVQGFTRLTTRDVELDGTLIPTGPGCYSATRQPTGTSGTTPTPTGTTSAGIPLTTWRSATPRTGAPARDWPASRRRPSSGPCCVAWKASNSPGNPCVTRTR